MSAGHSRFAGDNDEQEEALVDCVLDVLLGAGSGVSKVRYWYVMADSALHALGASLQEALSQSRPSYICTGSLACPTAVFGTCSLAWPVRNGIATCPSSAEPEPPGDRLLGFVVMASEIWDAKTEGAVGVRRVRKWEGNQDECQARVAQEN